jgi:hypothetical protein
MLFGTIENLSGHCTIEKNEPVVKVYISLLGVMNHDYGLMISNNPYSVSNFPQKLT